jgi:hypothetical protein
MCTTSKIGIGDPLSDWAARQVKSGNKGSKSQMDARQRCREWEKKSNMVSIVSYWLANGYGQQTSIHYDIISHAQCEMPS